MLHETHVQQAIKLAVRRRRIAKRASAHTFRHYLPFLTMSSNVKDSVGMFGNYYSRCLKAYLNTRHSFRLETVEKTE
jgi:hypothetical protein